MILDVAATHVVDAYLSGLPGRSRRVAPGEWGLTVPAEAAAGSALEVGLRLSEGMLRAKALAVAAGSGLDPWQLLWWNRQTRLVRFGCTRGGQIWVHGDLPLADGDLEERALDRLLGLVVEGAVAAREYAARALAR